MSAMSRRKGATAERELAKLYRAAGFPVERVPANGGPGDLRGLGGFHIEAKRQETLSLPQWIAQAERDCPDGDVPTVHFRRSKGKTPDRWWVCLKLEDFLPLIKKENDG